MKRMLICGAVLGLAASAMAATITPLGLTESRSVRLSESHSIFPSNSRLLVKISGDDVKGATSVGKFVATEVKDDTGKDFGKWQGNDAIKKLSEWDVNKQDGSFLFEIQLGAPAREAKTATIKGELTVLAGGDAKEVKIPLSVAEGDVADENLKAAGVTLKRDTPIKGDNPPTVFAVSGNPDAISKVKIVTKDGKQIDSNYNTYQDFKTKATMLSVIAFGPKPPEGSSIVLTVLVGQKAVKVPVDLKNVKLP